MNDESRSRARLAKAFGLFSISITADNKEVIKDRRCPFGLNVSVLVVGEEGCLTSTSATNRQNPTQMAHP